MRNDLKNITIIGQYAAWTLIWSAWFWRHMDEHNAIGGAVMYLAVLAVILWLCSMVADIIRGE
jgi:hypothetical protein